MSDTEQENPGTRVFLGNLSYRLGENELQDLLKPYGEVESINLAMKMGRFRGYAFANFVDKAAADEAVKNLHGTMFLERELVVERANPSRPRRVYDQQGYQGRNDGDNYVGDGEENPRARRGRERQGPRRAPQDGEEGTHEDEATHEGEEGGEPNLNRSSGRGQYRYPVRNGPGGEARDHSGGRGYRGRWRGNRTVRNRTNLPDSDTLLFVSNLPYSFEDDDLAEVFQGLSIDNARVVRFPGGQARGFGFVEMANHEAQQDALDRINGIEAGGRVLVVKVAKERSEDRTAHQDDHDDQEHAGKELNNTTNGAEVGSSDQVDGHVNVGPDAQESDHNQTPKTETEGKQ